MLNPQIKPWKTHLLGDTHELARVTVGVGGHEPARQLRLPAQPYGAVLQRPVTLVRILLTKLGRQLHTVLALVPVISY